MPPPSYPITALAARATQLLKAGSLTETIHPLREAALLRPANAAIQHDLGLTCLELGLLSEAVSAFQNAIAANPRFTSAFYHMAIALERQGESGAAIAAYDRVTELHPSHTAAWFRAGALVFTLGHREEAIGCFERATAIGPKTNFGRLGAARALLAQERDNQAEQALRKVLALDPQDPIANDLLASLLADMGRCGDARHHFGQAIKAAPLMARRFSKSKSGLAMPPTAL